MAKRAQKLRNMAYSKPRMRWILAYRRVQAQIAVARFTARYEEFLSKWKWNDNLKKFEKIPELSSPLSVPSAFTVSASLMEKAATTSSMAVTTTIMKTKPPIACEVDVTNENIVDSNGASATQNLSNSISTSSVGGSKQLSSHPLVTSTIN